MQTLASPPDSNPSEAQLATVYSSDVCLTHCQVNIVDMRSHLFMPSEAERSLAFAAFEGPISEDGMIMDMGARVSRKKVRGRGGRRGGVGREVGKGETAGWAHIHFQSAAIGCSVKNVTEGKI